METMRTKRNMMTPAIAALIGTGNVSAARFAANAPRFIGNPEPSMIIGRPDITSEYFEDRGRTLVMPVSTDCPKLYACQNETGGVTIMLPEEY